MWTQGAKDISSRDSEAWQLPRPKMELGMLPGRLSQLLSLPCLGSPCHATAPATHWLSTVLDLTLNDILGSWAAISQSGKEDKIISGMRSK